MVRNSNFELLRIIAMFIIVVSHYSVHGTYTSEVITTTSTILEMFSLGKIGSNLFVMIGAYFMIDRGVKISQIINLSIRTYLYSLLIVVCASLFFEIVFTDVYKYIFQFYDTYWFVTTYVMLMILAPVLNSILTKITNNQLKNVLLVMTVFLVISPTYRIGMPINDGILFFVYLYLVTAYIKKQEIRINVKKYLAISLSITMLHIVFRNIVPLLFSQEEVSKTINLQLTDLGLLTVSNTVLLFLLILNARKFESKVVNKVASGMFSVYLIHEHPIIRKLLWGYIDTGSVETNIELIIKMMTEIPLIFIGLTVVAYSVDKVVNPISNKLTIFVLNKLNIRG